MEKSFVSVRTDLLYLWKSCNLANIVLKELIKQTVRPWLQWSQPIMSSSDIHHWYIQLHFPTYRLVEICGDKACSHPAQLQCARRETQGHKTTYLLLCLIPALTLILFSANTTVTVLFS